MLTTTTEIWPFGDGTQAKRLVTINIANYGKNEDGETYNYIFTIEEPSPLFGSPIRYIGKVEGWDRRSTCLGLLAAALAKYTESPSQPDLPQADLDAGERIMMKNT